MNDNETNNIEPNVEDPSNNEGSSSIEKAAADPEPSLEGILEDLPPEKQSKLVREMFVGFMERSAQPSITPEVARILAESQDKDNENKFQYLTKQLDKENDKDKRNHEFRLKKHDDNFSIIKPIIWGVVLLVIGTTIAGIWLCVIGKEAIGAAILSGIWGAVFGYLAGFGTSNFFKNQ